MKKILKKRKPCEDCGEYPVNHRAEWFGAILDSAVTPVGIFFSAAISGVKPTFVKYIPDRMMLPAFRFFSAIGLGTLKGEVDEEDSGRNRWLWDSAKRKGIAMHQFRVLGRSDGTDFFVAEWRDASGARKIISFEGLPRPVRAASRSLEWMDNKAILKKRFTAAGIPMARGRACRTFAQALKTMKEVGAPVITKPHIGSRSRHSTIGIKTPEALRIGFEKAKQLSPWVIVEQELQGYLFRVLLIDGKIGGIIRRERAHVVGDGVTTIRELVERENKNPKRSGPTFHHLPTDAPVDYGSIPARGETVVLNEHISRWYGGSTSDFTERVHPDNAALFEHIAAVLGDSLVGVDFIIEDMERSWREQKLCGVIECNSLPNIDLHHEVLYGQDRDIAGMLFDIAFKKW
jgi:D-alanine-D-alanine ligase-like ATP-grasp enzyme